MQIEPFATDMDDSARRVTSGATDRWIHLPNWVPIHSPGYYTESYNKFFQVYHGSMNKWSGPFNIKFITRNGISKIVSSKRIRSHHKIHHMMETLTEISYWPRSFFHHVFNHTVRPTPFELIFEYSLFQRMLKKFISNGLDHLYGIKVQRWNFMNLLQDPAARRIGLFWIIITVSNKCGVKERLVFVLLVHMVRPFIVLHRIIVTCDMSCSVTTGNLRKREWDFPRILEENPLRFLSFLNTHLTFREL